MIPTTTPRSALRRKVRPGRLRRLFPLLGVVGLGCATISLETADCKVQRTSFLRRGEFELTCKDSRIEGIDYEVSPGLEHLGIAGFTALGALVGTAVAPGPGTVGGAGVGAAVGVLEQWLGGSDTLDPESPRGSEPPPEPVPAAEEP